MGLIFRLSKIANKVLRYRICVFRGHFRGQKTADILRQWGSNYSKMNVFKLAKLIQELYYFLTKGREYESNEL